MFADDTYIVIPAVDADSRSAAELDHVDRWMQNNNLRLCNRANSTEIVFTNCKREHAIGLLPQIPDIRSVTTIKMLGEKKNISIFCLELRGPCTRGPLDCSHLSPPHCCATACRTPDLRRLRTLLRR